MGASKVACASFDIGTNTTITITRDNKNYTHTLRYSFNGASGTIVEKTTETSYVWEANEEEFYSRIPNTTSGYGTVTCETYNGSTVVGTTTAGFYAYTVRNACEPTVSGEVVDSNQKTIALTGSNMTIVRHLSQPTCILTAEPKNGATLKSIQIENPVGLVTTTNPFTFDTVYSDEFKFKATDSRGYSKTTTVKVASFIEYDPCHFETVPVVERTESSSTSASTKISGYCFKGNFGKEENTLSVKYRCKTNNEKYGEYTNVEVEWAEDGKFTSNVTIPDLSTEETYTIEFVVEDKLTSFPVEVVLGQSVGDFRIAKDHVLVKNNLYIGSKRNEEPKAVKTRMTAEGKVYEANFGVEKASGTVSLREDGKEVAAYNLRKDGYLYNAITDLSVAEILAEVPTGVSGSVLINSGTTPILVQWGMLSTTPAGASFTTIQNVQFEKHFTDAPFIHLGKNTGKPSTMFVSVGSVTKEGFNICFQRSSTATTSIPWVAIGTADRKENT